MKILDENGTLIHEGEANEMLIAFEYLTKPAWKLAEKRGYKMKDFHRLNSLYYTEAAKTAIGSLQLIN